MNLGIVFKIIGSIMIVFSGYSIGRIYCQMLKDRIIELEELEKIMYVIQGNIRYSNNTLPEIMGEISCDKKGIFNEFFEEVYKNINEMRGQNFKQIWEDAIDKKLSKLALTEQDRKDLKKIGDIAGKMDKQMQYDNMNLFVKNIEEKIKKLSSEYSEKSRMYRLLSISLSTVLVIILV